VNVRGLQVGGTTTITIDGDDLGKTPKLLLPFAAKQTLKSGGTDKKAEFEVTLDDTVTPGLYHMRIVTDGGSSLPVVIGVDRLAQKPLTASIEALPAAVHGTVSGSSIAETTFTGKANEKVTVEVEAQRIGSKLRPVIHLYTAKKLQLAWAWGKPTLSGDARLEATLPADGTYTVTVHDAEYAGPNPGFFRLKVGQFGYVDQVFPPVIGKNEKAVELIGSGFTRTDLPPPKGNTVLLDWPKEPNWTGPRPWVEVSSRAEFIEQTTTGKPQELPAGPVAVSGKLISAFEEDRYRVEVKPNTKVRFEVFAERFGSLVDAALVIRNDAGGVVAQAEDSPGTLDPALEYTVPDKITAVTVGVVDSSGRGGPRAAYRLVIDPVKAEGRGDFRLTTPVQRLAIPAGGRVVVPVFAERRGFTGMIDLLADGLPTGVTLEGTTIPPGADGALVTVTAAEFEAAAVTTWKGRSAGGYSRDIVLKGHPLERLQPWLASELVIAPSSAKAGDFTIDWRKLPDNIGLSPGGKLALPVTVKRNDPALPVRLVLLTSQSPPLANNQPDLNRAIRPERPIELAAKTSDGEMPVLLPAELPADSYQIAVQAELLSTDKQKVLATAVTPVRNFFVKLPVSLKADGTKIDAKLDPKTGATVEVHAAAVRQNGFTGDIAVSLTGLPPGVPVPPPLTLKPAGPKLALKLALPLARQSVTIRTPDPSTQAFTIKLTLPPTIAPGETKLQLSASVVPNPAQPNVRVKGRDVELTLRVAAPK
jgi:hypothetical protein